MPVAQAISDSNLQQSILTICEAAMRQYLTMSGEEAVPERFAQVSCAINLYQIYNRLVTIETNRSTLMRYFPRAASRLDGIPSEIANRQFKVDLLVYDPVDADPANAHLRAVVEFKQDANQQKAKWDIERTRHVLAALSDEPTPVEGQRFGYQVLCVVYGSDLVDLDVDNMGSVARDMQLGCEPQVRKFVFEPQNAQKLYCGVIGLVISAPRMPTQKAA